MLTRPMIPGRTLPLLVERQEPSGDAMSWLRDHRAELQRDLLTVGTVLLRGLAIDSAERFERAISTLGEDTMEYHERSSPRSHVLGNIYTSTDYPAKYRIYLHNENSYASRWPLRLFFCCVDPPATGGETPIADSRRIYQRVPATIREEFVRRGVMYLRNFSPDMGLSWRVSFQTEERSVVEEICARAGIQMEWLPGDRLRTRSVRPAVARHPRTGEWTWFNHATFFHITTLEPAALRQHLMSSYAEDDLPNNTYYGDGGRIEDDVLSELRRTYEGETVSFPWQRGDLMLVDNMLVAHGRSAYTGPRRVLVAMAQPIDDAASIRPLGSAP